MSISSMDFSGGISNDTGSSNSDGNTTARTFTLSGDYVRSNGSGDIFVYAKGGEIGSTWTLLGQASLSFGTWTFNLNSATTNAYRNLDDGSYTFGLRTSDTGSSAPSVTMSVVIDNVAPSAPVISYAGDEVGPIFDNVMNGGATDDAQPVYTGTAEPGATIKLWRGTTLLASDTADANGKWAFYPNNALTGTVTVTATATDKAGNVSGSSNSFALTIDTSSPNTTLTFSGIKDDGGAAITTTTTDNTPTLWGSVGSANSDVRVAIYDNDKFVALVDPDGSKNWTYTFAELGTGSHKFTAKISDDVGNLRESTATNKTISIQAAPDTTPPDTVINVDVPAYSAVNFLPLSFWSGDSDVAKYEYKLDNGAWTDATGSSAVVTGLSQGSHTVLARAIDKSGNADLSPASATWIVDSVKPETSITISPGAYSNAKNPTFTFSGSDATSGIDYFEVNLDNAGWVSSAASKSYTNLTTGSHTLQVRAVDKAGNTDASPESYTWTIDTVAPDTTITSGVPGKSANATITFAGTDTGSGVASYEYQLDGGAWTATTATSQALTGLGDGSHTFQVRAIDKAGNVDGTPASVSWTVETDTTPPDTTASGAPASVTNSKSANFTFGSNETGVTYSINGGAFSATNTKSYTNLADGTYTVTATAKDAAGNVDPTPYSYTWTVDTVALAPTVALATDTGSSTTDKITKTATLNVTGVETNATVEYSATGANGAWSTTAPTPTEGPNSVYVRQTDQAGNVSPSTKFDFTYDSQVAIPTASLQTDSGSNGGDKITNDGTIKVTGVEANATVQYSSVGGAGGPWSTTAPTVTQGSNTIYVRQIDVAGNSSAQYTLTFTYDTTKPDTSIVTKPASTTNSADASFTFSGTDASGVDGYEVNLDNAGWVSSTASKSYTGLAEGSHDIQVRAKDVAGNTDDTPATYTWSVDTTAPDTTATGAPASVTNSKSATFTFGSNEAGVTYSIDGGAFSTTNTKTFTNLADGAYTVTAIAKDAAGNVDATPYSYTWKVDTTAPDTTATGAPAALTNSKSANFTFGSNETGVTYSIDGGAFSTTNTKSFSNLADGVYTITAIAKDAAGNVDPTPYSYTWKVDTTAPSLAIDTKPNAQTNSPAANFTFSSDDGAGVGGVTYEYSIDGKAFEAASGAAQSFSNLLDGSHTFQVRAKDSLGNTSSAASHTWTIDTGAPDTTITAVPAAISNSTSATFLFLGRDNNGGTGVSGFETQLDNGAWTSGSSPRTFVNLIDGEHTFRVRAKDAAGNVDETPASYVWTVDTTPPPAPVVALVTDSGAPGDKITKVGALTVTNQEANATVVYAAAPNGPWDISPPALSQGSNTVYVRQVDQAGNVSATTTFVFTYDTQAEKPTVALAHDTGANTSDGLTSDATLSVTNTEADALIEYSVDGVNGWSASAPPPTQGSNTLFVRQTDKAGNASQGQSITFTYDSANPAFTSGASVQVNEGATAAYTAVASDASSLVYALASGGDNDLFNINTATGAVTFKTAPNFESPDDAGANHVYNISVKATDAAGNVSTQTVNVIVLDVNEAPVGAPVSVTVAEDATGVLATASVSDPDAGGANNGSNDFEDLSYAITGGDPNHLFVVDAATGAISLASGKALDFETAQQHVLTVTATDRNGAGLSTTSVVTINVTNVNEAPTVAHALAAQSFDEDTTWTYVVPANTFADVDSTLTYSAKLANGLDLPDWLHFDAATRTFSGKPPLNSNETLNLKVIASDGQFSADSTFTMTINPVNDLPTGIAPVTLAAIAEDSGPRTINTQELLGGAADVDNALSIADLQISSGKGALTPGGALGTWFYVPAANDDTSVSFTYKIVGDPAGPIITTATLDITPVNDAPTVANPIAAQSVNEDTAWVFTVPANTFADVDGDTLTYSATLDGGALPNWLSFNTTTGAFSGTPPLNFHGSYTIVVAASDGSKAAPATSSFTLNVVSVNDAPTVANPIAAQSVNEDTAWAFTVPANTFADVDGDILTYSATLDGGALPTWLSLNTTTGAFSGTPPLNFNGSYTIVVAASDGSKAAPATSSFTLNVNPVNDAPTVANAIAAQSVNEDSAWAFTVPANTFADVDGDTLTYSATLDGGALPAWLSFNTTTGAFSGTPPLNFHGSYTIVVAASDGSKAASATSSFTINVVSVNDAPVVAGALSANATEDGAKVTISALTGASDVDGDTLSVTNVPATLPDGVSYDPATKTFTLDPTHASFQSLAQGATKQVSVSYKVSDGNGGSVDQTASWTVTGTNDLPVAHDDAYTINEDGFLTVLPADGVFKNDTDVDFTGKFGGALIATTQHGAFVGTGDGGFTYKPNADFNGTDTFTYQAIDDHGNSNTATVTINVTAVNDAPVVVGTLTANATEDSGVSTVSAISNASDVDGDALSVTNYVLPTGVTYDANSKSFKLDANNAAFQSLKAGATQDVVVNYKVSDGVLKADNSIKWTITGVNDAPTAGVIAKAAVNEDASKTVSGLSGAGDVDGDTLSVTDVGALPAGVTFDAATNAFTLNAGNAAYQGLKAGATQDVTVDFKVSDGTAKVDQHITWTVTGANDAPVVSGPVTGAVNEDASASLLALSKASDVDVGDTLTVTDVGALPAGVTFNSGTNTFTLNAANSAYQSLKAGATQTVTVTYKVSDGTTKTDASASWVVTGTNDAPTAVALNGQVAIDENSAAGTVVGTLATTDVDVGDTHTYSVTTGGSKFEVVNGKLVVKAGAALNFEADSTETVTVVSTDGSGATKSQTFTVNLMDVNEAPTSTDQTVSVNENISTSYVIATSNATDPDVGGGNDVFSDNEDLTYAITGGNTGSRFEIDSQGRITLASGKSLNFETDPHTYTLTVKATDGDGLSTTSTVTINLQDVNEAPVLVNGSTHSVSIDENQTTVTTFTAIDPDAGDTVSYKIVGGIDQSKFEINSATGALTLKTAANYENPTDFFNNNIYSVQVQAKDSKGLTDTQTLTVTIKDVNDVAPVITSTAVTPSIAENALTSSVVFDAAATDGDSSAAFRLITYSLTGDDAAKFDISSTGKVTFKASPDFEAKSDLNGDNVYKITVHAKDGVHDTAKDVTVTLTDVNDNTPSITSAATFTVFENNGTTVGTVTATDADVTPAFKTITYSISGGADAALFNIDGATGALKLNAAADFEAKSTYNLTVKASDGTLSSTQDVTVKVTDVNEAPTAADVSATVAENVAAGTVLATVVGSDPDTGGGNDALNDYENLNYSITGGNAGGLFTIDAVSGQVKLAAGKALDFEAAGSHVLTVTTTDGGGLTKTSTVTINVTDVNEAPTTADLAPVTFAESTAAGTVLATVIGSDPDTGGGNDALNTYENLSYSITGGNAGGLFAIDATTGVVTLAAGKALDYETATSHVLTVTTTDGGGLTKTSTVTINVTDVNDVAPVFTLAGLQTPGGTFSVNAEENVATTTTVLDAAATDGDVTPAFKVITYSLSGDDAGKFDISSTGKVTFKASPNFDIAGDANANNIYAITVTASDGVHTTSKDVAIQLTDVNDITPQITSGATATVAENSVGAVYTATAVDTDLTPAFRNITYSLAAGGDNDLFNINGVTGVVTFKASPNFEAPLDSDKNNSYVLTVRASDGVNVGTKTVTVNVTDLVEDSGPANTAGLAITSTNATINDNTPLILGVASSTLAGQTVTLFEGTTQRGTGVIQANGSWSIESSNVGADGAHSFTAQLGSSISNSVTLTIDTVAPVVAITGTTGTGFSPSVNGTASVADVGRTVTLFDGSTAVGTGTVGTGGAFSVTALLTGTGPHSLTASVTDLAGNVGTSAATAYTIAPQPAQGQIDGDNLKIAYQNIMDGPASSQTEGAYLQDLVSKLSLNLMTYKEALDAVIDHADGTTSVATLSYQFFTGKIPTKAGLDYLVSTTGGNANNINSAYYQDFNIENRYINFAVNLGHDGAGKDAFQTKYGALTLFDATKKAYAEIFGATPTDAKVHELLDTTFSFGGKTITRADYFASYGHDAIGTKAAMVGWLLSEAVKADVGTYATANEAFLNDLADGATFNVDLIGTYSAKAIPLEILG